MTRPLVLLRPEPGWSDSAASARAMGLEVAGAPLFAIEPVNWECPDASGYDGILIGSANALRHGGDALASLRHLPAWTVGTTTAQAARDAGFAAVHAGTGGLQAVLGTIPAPARLLRLAGEAHVPLVTPPGIAVDTAILYRSRALPLSDTTRAALAGPAVVALHSGEAARHFAAECARLAIPREGLDLLCIGPRVAALAGEGWGAIHTVATPDEGAMLAMARRMCHIDRQAP